MAKLKTGRHTSALKEVRKTKKRTARNTSIKSEVKTAIKKVKDLVKKKDAKGAGEELKSAFSKLDKAAKRNVIHYKNAANHKAKLSKKVASIK
ncbi:MAG: 30S ribosomal protein S20 [Elusimicrobiota bacterium]|jgi:small subunit ribosomal protein S20|nr:30S ribosomal protein S20 [Elusimicrobiota bacterium]